MRRQRRILGTLMLAAALSSLTAAANAETSYDYASLIRRMTDLQSLAELPPPGETCKQWSSWDRASRYDAPTGKYVRWDANGDGSGVIRKEGEQSVMAEMEGPGCIWRIWSARALEGHVKIYLDGSDQPAVDLPFKKYFSGDTTPFSYPSLSYDLNQHGCSGQNLYFPIPYQKSCKVLADPKWGNYYHFVYTTFPPGTKVPTFSAELASRHREELQRVNSYFASQLGTHPPRLPDGCQTIAKAAEVKPGESVQVVIEGPRAIAAIRGRMPFSGRDDEMQALREMAIRITWDDQPEAAVWCPLGDFFGTAPGVNLYRSLATGMTEEGAYAFWYMPFGKKSHLQLVNEGRTARSIEFEITHAPLAGPIDSLGYFHCKWHRDTQRLPPDRWPDWVMLSTKGRGRFCGVMLHVWNPRGGWWGEGDEKFFVDGEKFPSTFGTGSEDYFGYAWCHPGLFQRPYHCQTMTMGNKGHQSVLRWHIADNVPFQESFEACIEKYYRTEEKGTQYAITAVWYLASGGTDPYGPVPVSQRHGYYEMPPLVAGGFQVLGSPPGNVRTQAMAQFRGKWAASDQLWWTGAKPGARLELAVPVAEDGTYELSGVFTKARDYGIVQLYLDGKKAGGPIDLYHPAVIRSEPIPLGRHALAKGDHVLMVEIVGANPKAIPSYMFGLDELIWQKAK